MFISALLVGLFIIHGIALPFGRSKFDPELVEVTVISEVDFYEDGRLVSRSLTTTVETQTVYPSPTLSTQARSVSCTNFQTSPSSSRADSPSVTRPTSSNNVESAGVVSTPTSTSKNGATPTGQTINASSTGSANGAAPAAGGTDAARPSANIPQGALTVDYVDPKEDEDTFAAISVWHHNIHRSNHSAPPIVWNHTLFEAAQWKADNCTFNEEGIPWLSNLGMNIAGGTYGSDKKVPNPSAMISGLWYNSELMNFPAYGVDNLDANGGAFESWGHFSQLVWPETGQIGCGLTDCGDSWFGACLYSPPGNYVGHFSKVGRPKGNPSVYPNGQDHM